MQSRQWDSTVFKDEEEVGNWGNQNVSKQPFFCYSESVCLEAVVITRYRTEHLESTKQLWLSSCCSVWFSHIVVTWILVLIRVMAKFQLLSMWFCITQSKFFPPTRIPATKEPACRTCQALPSDIQFVKIRYCSEDLYSCSIAVPYLPVHALQITQRVVNAVSVRPLQSINCKKTRVASTEFG